MNKKSMIAGALVALGTFAAAAFGGPVAWILAWCAVFAACAWKGGARMKWLAMIPATTGAWFACMCAALPAEGRLSPAQVALLIVSLFAVVSANMVFSGLASRSGGKTQKGE